jgi:hypothetical protein
LPSRSLSFWFIQRRVIDPAQTLAAARAVIGGVLTIVSVTIARQSATPLEIIKFLVRRTIPELDGLRLGVFGGCVIIEMDCQILW